MEFAHKLFSTRGGTLVLAGLAAVLAAVSVLVYVRHYRSSVKAGGQPATVLVASKLIPKGTAGRLVGTLSVTAGGATGKADFSFPIR